MQRVKTERTWFTCLLQHPTKKRSGSVVTTPEPALGGFMVIYE